MDEKGTEQPAAPEPSEGGGGKNTGLATAAHALGIFIGFVGPLIIFLIEQKDSYVKSQAKEALNFQITIAILWVASWFLSFIFIGFIFLPIIGLANLILCIIAAMAASKGKDYRYPFALRLIK